VFPPSDLKPEGEGINFDYSKVIFAIVRDEGFHKPTFAVPPDSAVV
jgi:hypothetical protein